MLNKKCYQNVPLNVYTRHDSAQEKLKTQHQITAVIMDKVSLF